MEMSKFYCCKENVRNNYRSRNLIDHYPFWVISPRNSTSFTRPFLAGRRARAGHETRQAPEKPGTVASEQPPKTTCSRCGKSPSHDRQQSPARDAVCHKCAKRGRYQSVDPLQESRKCTLTVSMQVLAKCS